MMTKRRIGQLMLAVVSFCICFTASALPMKITHNHSTGYNFPEQIVGAVKDLYLYEKSYNHFRGTWYAQVSKHDFGYESVANTSYFEVDLPAGEVVSMLDDDDIDMDRPVLNHDHKTYDDVNDDVAVQEPMSIALLGLGLVLLGFFGRIANIRELR